MTKQAPQRDRRHSDNGAETRRPRPPLGRWQDGPGVRAIKLHDVICRREAGSAVVEGITQEWVWRSPSGFERGCGGSGPAELALDILPAATGDSDFSAQHHQAFQRRFVATLPAEGG